jgi:hypothetical protein
LESFEVYAHDSANVVAGNPVPSKRTRAIPAENELVRFDGSAR